MIEFLTADGNLPFAVALVVMLAIAVLEGTMMVLGAGLSSLLEGALPDVDIDAAAATGGFMSSLLGWLRFGEVPALILLVLFLTAFGLVGLGIQSAVQGVTGMLLPWPVAVVPAFLLSLPVVRTLGGVFGRLLLRDETDALASDTLVGRVAVITLGTARVGHPAEARTKDRNGTTHYVMVEPFEEAEELPAGTEVLIIEPAGAGFRVARADHSALLD